ncbi:MAG: hypothetical protein WC466_02115 [Candidatus Izemoplasmatales bacterium]
MSYIVQEPSNFINMKLTDTGRRLLSLGALTFNKIIFSDREVNYYMELNNSYNICRNRVLSPKDDHPKINFISSTADSFDGTPAAQITSQTLTSARQIVSAMTSFAGFFTGDTNYWSIKTATTIGEGYSIGIAEIDYSATIPSGGTTVDFVSGGYTAQTGNLVFIPWEPPQYSAITNSSTLIYSGRPNVSLWYRVQGVTGLTMELDRAVPNFGSSSISGSTQKVKAYFYPYGQVETYYGSSTTINCGVWNMNIVRTTSVIGTSVSMSGYSSYGSIEFNGTKQYLGFDNNTEAFGIIHYTNKYSGNTYAEQLVPSTVQLEIPYIMWHKNYSTTLGQEMNYGLVLYDYYGDNEFDSVAQTNFRYLRDGTSSTSTIVGRVYHKLKLIVITDQELLTVLSYKSNRNYTLPPLTLNLAPSTVGSTTGLCKTDYTYYVTYAVSSDPYAANTSFGYPQSLPCAYIQQISGQTDGTTSLPSVLRANFPTLSFPYMRNQTNISALSGTGWNANSVQLLVQEIVTSADTKVGDLPTNNWILISDGVGNGIYTGETGTLTISPSDLQSHVFNIDQADYDSGTTYSFDGKFSAFTQNSDIFESGMTFGSEAFFYGSMKTGIQANVYKTTITIFAKNDAYNSSQNSTFDSLYNDSTYITEIGILNSNDELVAVAKPAYPIEKNESRYLAFQLELDF